ncbi:MAG: hypothetical protein KJO01_05775 [Gammaproteobacteria bacterium]|nr:hypothetical protein [Gammaproteobacteria bacterium]
MEPFSGLADTFSPEVPDTIEIPQYHRHLRFMTQIVGVSLMLLVALRPAWFEHLTVVFAGYAILVLYLTA